MAIRCLKPLSNVELDALQPDVQSFDHACMRMQGCETGEHDISPTRGRLDRLDLLRNLELLLVCCYLRVAI